MSQRPPGSAPEANLHAPIALEPATPEEPTSLDAFLPTSAPAVEAVEEVEVVPSARPPSGMRSARLVGLAGRTAAVVVRGEDQPIEVSLDTEVDAVVIRDALQTGERVMVEADEERGWVVVGVLRSRQPETLRLTASVVEIEADREVLLRSGRAAVRLREDGEVEIVGSRISAASRGLFRLVGRMLRLN